MMYYTCIWGPTVLYGILKFYLNFLEWLRETGRSEEFVLLPDKDLAETSGRMAEE